MSGRTVTCVMHGGPVDDGDTLEMPNGPVCVDCYAWLERMIEEGNE